MLSSISSQAPRAALTSSGLTNEAASTKPNHAAPSARASLAAVDTVEPSTLPPRIQAIKQAVIALAGQNTTRTDNTRQVRAQLQPLVDELAAYFAKHRPAAELELTRGSWRNLWFDDPTIDAAEAFARLDRSKIWQVVEQDYYINVSENRVRLLGVPLLRTHAFLRGNYTIQDPAGPETAGQPRRNVIALEFAGNRARLGRLPDEPSVRELARAVTEGARYSLPIPGPRGVRGELWNLYVDRDLRIAAGQQLDDPGVTDLYILQRDGQP